MRQMKRRNRNLPNNTLQHNTICVMESKFYRSSIYTHTKLPNASILRDFAVYICKSSKNWPNMNSTQLTSYFSFRSLTTIQKDLSLRVVNIFSISCRWRKCTIYSICEVNLFYFIEFFLTLKEKLCCEQFRCNFLENKSSLFSKQ
jgi:hypothetical protein